MVDQVPSTFPSMFMAYAVLWGVLSVYIFWLGRRLARLERSLREGLEK